MTDFVDPVLLAIGVALVVTALYLVTRPVVDRRLSMSARGERRLAELRAREIVRRHGRGTLDYFALRDDKQFFFFRDSLVAYAVYGGVALISPDPSGPRPSAPRSSAPFALRRGPRVDHRRDGRGRGVVAHLSRGRAALPYLGDEAIVDCRRSRCGRQDEGPSPGLHPALGYGYTVEFLDPSKIDPARALPSVESISLLRRGGGERDFP